MALTPGTRVGPYAITGSIGAGGMGEVYRATDTNLDRQVAIKVLPEAFAHDSERLARFEREAKTLAALNHPHIAQIYGLEKSAPSTHSTGSGQAGVMALVMELVEGEDLSERIARGAIPLDDALPIARQIAEALEAAHEQGIIHRDLKPANIKVTPQGTVKVLDFGLAKLVEGPGGSAPGSEPSAVSLSPTITSAAMTGVGVLLGTAAYMSPEQAKGRATDRRGDIWAFGCVLFEMLSGRPVFEGGDVTDVLVGVLSKEPDWSALPPGVPPGVRTLVRRCLQKDRTQRLQSAGDARVEIHEAQSLPLPPDSQLRSTPATRRRVAAVGAACLLIGAAVAGVTAWVVKPTTEQGLIHLAVPLPLGDRLPAYTPAVAISPDGSRIAFVSTRAGTRRIFMRSLGSADAAAAIAGSEGAENPIFSPDGQWLGFTAGGSLMKVSLSGGSPFRISDAPDVRGASWGDSDTIAFAPRYGTDGLSVVPAAGGKPQRLTSRGTVADEEGHRWPQMLPGGTAVLFTAWNRNIDESRIVVMPLDTQKPRVVIEGGTYGRYIDSGHLIYVRAGALLAVRFDLSRLAVVGSPMPVVQDVSMTTEGAGEFAVSQAGTLVYIRDDGQRNGRTLVWVDRTGKEQVVDAPVRSYATPRLSPDGHQIVVVVEGVNDDVWVYDIARRTLSRLTSESRSMTPKWTPDGRRVVYRSVRDGHISLFARNADGSGQEERLTVAETNQNPGSISPDGRTLALIQDGDLWQMSLAGNGKPQPFLQSPFREGGPTFSPDGAWLAYQADESGRFEIYAQPFPSGGRKVQISREGGEDPRWTPSGELFYRVGTRLMMTHVATRPDLTVGSSEFLFAGLQFSPINYGYDVSTDGRRLLMVKENDQSTSATQISVVLNWTRELTRQMPK